VTVRQRSTRNRPARVPTPKLDRLRQHIAKYFLVWVLIMAIFMRILPGLLGLVLDTTMSVVAAAPGVIVNVGGEVLTVVVDAGGDALTWAGDRIGDLLDGESSPSGDIAPLFTAEVAYWEDDILRWAAEHSLDPNLMATVMQIESCGHPTVSSSAGAQGLFQVMPFHFGSTEDQLDPDTNALRGAGVLNQCLDMANGDAGLAMACYNGGPSVLTTPYDNWLNEPQRYYMWGTGIYADAQNNSATSETLDRWINAGGGTLCDWASAELGLN